MPETSPLILTALLDARSFASFDGLRRRYFPPELNRLPAHLTLFHHLPGASLPDLVAHLSRLTAGIGPMAFVTSSARPLGRGVAIDVLCPPLVMLREAVAASYASDLTAQDGQGFRPHVTVQNKAAPGVARATLPAVAAALPIEGAIDGLALWHYRGGPWERAVSFSFSGVASG